MYVDGASPKDVSGASPKDVQNNDATYFEFFGAEHIPKETKTFIDRPSPIKTKKDMIQ